MIYFKILIFAIFSIFINKIVGKSVLNSRKFNKIEFIHPTDTFFYFNCVINDINIVDLKKYETNKNIIIKRENEISSNIFSGTITVHSSKYNNITIRLNKGLIIFYEIKKLKFPFSIVESVIDFSNLYNETIDYPIIQTTVDYKLKKSEISKMYTTLDGEYFPIFFNKPSIENTSTNILSSKNDVFKFRGEESISYFVLSINDTPIVNLNNFNKEKFIIQFKIDTQVDFTGVLRAPLNKFSTYLLVISQGYVQHIIYLKKKLDFKYWIDITDYQYSYSSNKIKYPKRVFIKNNELIEINDVKFNLSGETITIY